MADLPIPAHFMGDPLITDEDLTSLDGWAVHVGAEPARLLSAIALGLDLEEEDRPPAAVARFRVEDVGAAEWCGRKLASLEAQRLSVRQRATEWRAQIDNWERDELTRTNTPAAFFTAHLEDYGRRCRAQTGKASTTLPSVKIATTNHKPKVVVVDEPTVIAWAKTVFADDVDKLEAVVKTKESVLLTGLRVEVEIDVARTDRTSLLLGCGCEIVTPRRLLGDERTFECSEHGMSSIVSREQVEDLSPRFAGREVPGCEVSPEHVTAKVTVV